MNWQLLTKILIYAGVLVYLPYDFLAYAKGGGAATESTTLGNWMCQSPWVLFALFLFSGHVSGSGPSYGLKMLLVSLAGWLTGLILTRI